MCWMLAQSNQNNQIKQLSSKHVSTSGMMNQLTFHSGFTTLLMLNLLHKKKQEKVKRCKKATTKDWTIGKGIQWWFKHWNAVTHLSSTSPTRHTWHNLIAVAGQKDRHAILMPGGRVETSRRRIHRDVDIPKNVVQSNFLGPKVLHQFGKIEAFSSSENYQTTHITPKCIINVIKHIKPTPLQFQLQLSFI